MQKRSSANTRNRKFTACPVTASARLQQPGGCLGRLALARRHTLVTFVGNHEAFKAPPISVSLWRLTSNTNRMYVYSMSGPLIMTVELHQALLVFSLHEQSRSLDPSQSRWSCAI